MHFCDGHSINQNAILMEMLFFFSFFSFLFFFFFFQFRLYFVSHGYVTGIFKIFTRPRNAPSTSRDSNHDFFSKGEQTIKSFWEFFQETKGKFENIS